MRLFIIKNIIAGSVLLFIAVDGIVAQETTQDTIYIDALHKQKEDQFYDSLKVRASQRKITRWFYDLLVTPPRPYVNKKELAINYYSKMEGKVISEIHIAALDVFGPTLQDTTKKASNWLERTANVIHTKSNLNTIRKMLLFKVGDTVDPELLYENERIIRALPYIKEITFILEQDSVYPGLVKVNVLTKDRFSFGVSGSVEGVESAALQIYNQNIFGVGHEISMRFVGHVNKQPYLGIETYYKINNINGHFIDASVGYLNTYKNEGFELLMNKRFFTPSIKWGYGATALRIFHSDRIFKNDPIVTEVPLNLIYYSGWAGRSFQIKQNQPENAQIVLSGGVTVKKFFERPIPETEDRPYFANSTFFLSGITFTQRRFVQDELVYSYGDA